MASRLHALRIEADDPRHLARFWAGLLGWDAAEDGVTLVPGDDTGFLLRFPAERERRTVRNQAHFDLTSTSPDDQERTVARALELGGRHIDVGQLPEEGHVVLADPEGNEFCVIEPGNGFLADCGFVGALACDGSQQVGYFWSAALGWPLVWDQDEETAIRSPHSGPKITWGGPPFEPTHGRNRLSFDVAPAAGAGRQEEVDRLVSLGAARVEAGDGRVVMADPDGNRFEVRAPR